MSRREASIDLLEKMSIQMNEAVITPNVTQSIPERLIMRVCACVCIANDGSTVSITISLFLSNRTIQSVHFDYKKNWEKIAD